MSRSLTYTRPWLAQYQTDAIFSGSRYAAIESSSKAGKTVGCIIWITEQAMAGKSGQNFWWVAPIYGQAKIAFRRLKRMIPREVYSANETELTLTLANGAIIWFKGSENPDSLFGEDVYAAVIDEASRVKEESWHAVRSTLTATEGPIRLIGNIKGRRNWFYALARRAESGEPGMSYAKITAYDAVTAGILTSDEVADAKRTLPDSVFRELYLAEPSDDGGNPFGLEAIRKCVNGLSDGTPVVWGWDLAKSVDWTVGIALDHANRVCRLTRFQQPWEDTIATILEAVGTTPALIDSTGVGDPVVEGLQKRGRETGTRIKGFKFTSQSKQQIMEGLAVAIQQAAIHIPEGWLQAELEAFEYVYTRTGVRYSAPEGLHDDGVCALALAVEQWRTMRAPLSFWGGVDVADESEEGRAAALQVARDTVTDRIRDEGVFWPNPKDAL